MQSPVYLITFLKIYIFCYLYNYERGLFYNRKTIDTLVTTVTYKKSEFFKKFSARKVLTNILRTFKYYI
jgi:hypothetical protein